VRKKVWTRLDNGLFAWRRTTKACSSSDTSETCSSTPRSSTQMKNLNLVTIKVPKIFSNLEESENVKPLPKTIVTSLNYTSLRVQERSPGMK
jgi:hypothetical protein